MAEKCPVPGMSELHEDMVDRPDGWQALTQGGIMAAYYAVPDFFSSKFMRFVAKSGLTAAAFSSLIHGEQIDLAGRIDELADKFVEADPDLKEALIVTGVVATGTTLAVLPAVGLERYLYRRAQRKKRAGKRFAHLRQGLVLGVIGGGIWYAIERFEPQAS